MDRAGHGLGEVDVGTHRTHRNTLKFHVVPKNILDPAHPSELLREALFTSGSAKLEDVRSFVRSFVRPFVRIIIDFYQEDMKGAETLLGTGSLNYGF